MIRWVAVGEEAVGVLAFGQRATGVVAVGQLATGVVAVGQLARGVFVVGQLAIGVVTLGQAAVGLWWVAAMVGVGGRTPGILVLPLLPRRAAPASAGGPALSPGPAPLAELTGRGQLRVRPWALVVLALLAVLWVVVVGQPLAEALFADGGVLNPERVLR